MKVKKTRKSMKFMVRRKVIIAVLKKNIISIIAELYQMTMLLALMAANRSKCSRK